MKFAAVALAAIFMCGCSSTPEERAAMDARQYAEDGATCASLGARTGDQEFQCRMALRNERNAISSHNGAMMQAAGQQLLNPPVYNSPQPTRRPVNCMAMQVGHMTTVNCI